MTVHARTTDPATSVAAARNVRLSVNPGTYLHRLLSQYATAGDTGLTLDEAAKASGVPRWAASKRVSDLDIHLGFTATNGAVRDALESNEEQVVRVITEAGLAHLEATKDKRPRQRKTRSREERVMEVVARFMEPPDDVRFATTQTKADKHPATFAREVRRAWES